MPRFTNDGAHYVHGKGGAEFCVDGVRVAEGGQYAVLDNNRVLFNGYVGPVDGNRDDPANWRLRCCTLSTLACYDFDTRAANFIIADGQGRWAAHDTKIGVFGSLGDLPKAGVRDGGHGTLALIPYFQDFEGFKGCMGVQLNTGPLQALDSACYGLRVIAPDDAVYIAGTAPSGTITTLKTKRTFLQAGPAFDPILFVVDGQEWLTYFTERLGVVAHPANSLTGYILVPADAYADYRDVWPLSGAFRLIWGTTQGEGQGQVGEKVQSLSEDRVDLAPPVVVVPDCVGDLRLVAQDGPSVTLEYRLRPGSGDVAAIRFLDETSISQPADNLLVHTYTLGVGTHALSVRGVGKNGKAIPTNIVPVTVEPPVVEPIPFLRGTNFMPQPQSLEFFRQAQFNAVRIRPRDVPPDLVPSWLRPHWIFWDEAELAMVPSGTPNNPTFAEYRNEPNLDDKPQGMKALTAAQYAADVLRLAPIAKARNIRVYWIGASNTGSAEQPYISEVIAKAGDAIGYVAIHRYPQDGDKAQDWSQPRKNFASLDEEMESLRRILKGRRMLWTEFGIRNSTWKTCFGKTKRVDWPEQAQLLIGYCRWIRAQPDIDGGFVFQSWETGIAPETFGLTDKDGNPKPALACWM